MAISVLYGFLRAAKIHAKIFFDSEIIYELFAIFTILTPNDFFYIGSRLFIKKLNNEIWSITIAFYTRIFE